MPDLNFHDSKERPTNSREIPEEMRDPGPRNMSPQGDAVRTLGREAERPSDSSTSPNRPSHPRTPMPEPSTTKGLHGAWLKGFFWGLCSGTLGAVIAVVFTHAC